MNKISKFILLAMVTPVVWSKTMYIDDILQVPLRSGPDTTYRIIHKGLQSGLPLQILGEDATSGYSHVKTPSGLEGYLQTRYLSAEPIAEDQLAAAKQKMNLLETEKDRLNKELEQLNQEFKALNSSHQKGANQLDQALKELAAIKAISADALNLDQRTRELGESNEQLRNELELVQAENMRLNEKSDSNMMLIGGGLVTLGVVLALLVPMIKPSKKNDSWA